MAFMYPPLAELFQDISIPISPLLVHLLIITISAGLSMYGIFGLVRHSKTFSSNWHLLAIAFALMAFMPVGDMFEHLELWPGAEYWHHFHLFAGVVAFYFMHYFITRMDSPVVESDKKAAATLLVLSALAVLFVYFEETFGDTYSWVLGGIYAVLVLVSLVYLKFLWDIVHRARKAEAAFSLKTFFISMMPIISMSLFILTFTGILAEAMMDVLPNSESNHLLVFLIALQNPLYLILAMTLAAYAYVGARIHAFYAPIEKFVTSKMAKGATSKGQLSIVGARRRKKARK